MSQGLIIGMFISHYKGRSGEGGQEQVDPPSKFFNCTVTIIMSCKSHLVMFYLTLSYAASLM